MLVHASCAARDGEAVLLLGPPGAGKSDLLLRMIHLGWNLVADDQVRLLPGPDGVRAAAPPALAGLIEVRGLGLLGGFRAVGSARVSLAVRLVPRDEVPRLPAPERHPVLDRSVPLVALHPFDASAPLKVGLALDAALGARPTVAGAFAA